MKTLLSICVSQGATAKNAMLVKLAKERLPTGWQLKECSPLGALPVFVAPEPDPNPPEVSRLKELIQSTDAVLVVTPEYIHSVPASLKNLCEWCVASGEFYEKRMAIWCASTGSRYVLPQAQDVFTTMTAQVVIEACGACSPTDEKALEWIKSKLALLLNLGG